MPQLIRKRTILAKIESTYGVDSVPTGSANAIQVRNLSVSPVAAELVGRDLIRPTLGNSDQLLGNLRVELDFEVELAGAVFAGDAPAYGPLLRACAFAQTLNTAAVTITRTGSVATATLNAHGFAVGSRVRIAGAAQTEYNGTFTITAVTTNTFDYAVTGTPITPATGTITVGRTAVYAPVSENYASVSIYVNVDGVLHRILGAMGSVELVLNARQIPVYRFNFIGAYATPTDTAAPSTDYTAWATPLICSTQNTTNFSFFGVSSLVLESFNVNMNNQVEYRNLIGAQYAQIVNRAPSGNAVYEATSIATLNIFNNAVNTTAGAVTIRQGLLGGNIVDISMPRVSIGNPTYEDSSGIVMINAPMNILPNAGNDEITITVR